MAGVDLRQKARELRADGMSMPEIAKNLGVHTQTVHSWLPTERERREGVYEKMAAMRDQGMTNIEIAKALNTTRHRVGALLGPSEYKNEPDPRRRIVVRVHDNQYEAVKRKMREQGVRWAKEGTRWRPTPINILLEEIASGRLQLEWAPGHGPYTYLLDGEGEK